MINYIMLQCCIVFLFLSSLKLQGIERGGFSLDAVAPCQSLQGVRPLRPQNHFAWNPYEMLGRWNQFGAEKQMATHNRLEMQQDNSAEGCIFVAVPSALKSCFEAVPGPDRHWDVHYIFLPLMESSIGIHIYVPHTVYTVIW